MTDRIYDVGRAVRARGRFAGLAGGNHGRRPGRPRSDALHVGTSRNAAVRWRRSAGSNSCCQGRRTVEVMPNEGRPAREVTLDRRAAAVEFRRPRGELLLQIAGIGDRRGGVAGLDKTLRDELGLLSLRELVQSGPSLRVLRHSSAMAAGVARAGRRLVFAQAAGYAGFLFFVRAFPTTRPKRNGGRSNGRCPSSPWSSRSRWSRHTATCWVSHRNGDTRRDPGRVPGRRCRARRSSCPAGTRKGRRIISACAG